jgi:glycosyltransferase involved in cell wall biosynthesis
VLSDRALADSLSRNGQEFVKNHFTLEAAIDNLEATYLELVKSK